jgi:hypothetical protein
MLIPCFLTIHSVQNVSAKETKDDNDNEDIKSQMIDKQCKDQDDNSACMDLKSKDFVTTTLSSNDTNLSIDNREDYNKKHRDPFLLPFP